MSRVRELRLLVIALGFTAAGLSLVFDGVTGHRVIGYIAIGFFGVLGILVFGAQVLRPPRLDLDAEGFNLHQTMVEAGGIRPRRGRDLKGRCLTIEER